MWRPLFESRGHKRHQDYREREEGGGGEWERDRSSVRIDVMRPARWCEACQGVAWRGEAGPGRGSGRHDDGPHCLDTSDGRDFIKESVSRPAPDRTPFCVLSIAALSLSFYIRSLSWFKKEPQKLQTREVRTVST